MARSVLDLSSREPHCRVLLSPETIMRRALRCETLYEALDLMCRLEADEYVTFLAKYIEAGLQRFGEDWRYADIVTVLIAAASTCRPTTYLEVGVRRGRSLAAVVTHSPEVSVYAFDMWVSNYGGMPNPGPEFVRTEMRRIGYTRPITFIDGNSHFTLPRFLAGNPDLRFDLITVDGDHTRHGALRDLRDVLPRLTVGGVIVFDDIVHPFHRYLDAVWRKAISDDGGIRTHEYTELGYGVAVGVRHAAARKGPWKSYATLFRRLNIRPSCRLNS